MNKVTIPGFRFAVGGVGQSAIAAGQDCLVLVEPGQQPIVRELDFGSAEHVEVRPTGALVTVGESKWIVDVSGASVPRPVPIRGTPDRSFSTFFDDSVMGEITCRTLDGQTYGLIGLERLERDFTALRWFGPDGPPYLNAGLPPDDVRVYLVRETGGRYAVGPEVEALFGTQFLGAIGNWLIGAAGDGETLVAVSRQGHQATELDLGWLSDRGDSVDVYDTAFDVTPSTCGLIALCTEDDHVLIVDPEDPSRHGFLGWRGETLVVVDDIDDAWTEGSEDPRALIRLDRDTAIVTLRDGIAIVPFENSGIED